MFKRLLYKLRWRSGFPVQLIILAGFVLSAQSTYAQSAGQWGICEFATTTTLNAYDPSSGNWDCKLAYCQANNLHYYWDGSAWAEMNIYNIYTQDDTLTSTRTLTLNGNDLIFDADQDIIIESSGNLGIGTATPAARLDVDQGSVRFSDYGGGTQTGTATYMLAVDADGDIIESQTSISSRIFYPPAIAIDASATGTGFTLDLHQEYVNRFSTPAVASTSAPAAIPSYAETELYYYVTDFDIDVFENLSIDDAGVLTYDIKDSPDDNFSLINVVFVVK